MLTINDTVKMLNIVFRNVNMLHSWVTGFFFFLNFYTLKKKPLTLMLIHMERQRKHFFYIYIPV